MIAEYSAGASTPIRKYVYGVGGLINTASATDTFYYYQGGDGSTSQLASSTGALLEWYRYDLQGTPFFYAPDNSSRTTSSFATRYLFTGQEWYHELGLYNLRNRFYSPDLGRFLQPDPIGFGGGNNLYRYCGNNAVNRGDPFGLREEIIDYPPVNVDGGGGGSPFGIGSIGAMPGTFSGGGPSAGAAEAGHYVRDYAPGMQQSLNDPETNDVGDGTQVIVGAVPGDGQSGANGVANGTGSNSSGGANGGSGSNSGSSSGTSSSGGSGNGGSGSAYSGGGLSPSGAGGHAGERKLGDVFNYPQANKRIAAIGREFASYNLEPLANGLDRFALGTSIVLAAPVAGPLALEGVYAIGWQGIVPTANAAIYAVYRYPNVVGPAQQAVSAFVQPGTGLDFSSGSAYWGSVSNVMVNEYLEDIGHVPIGP